MRVLILGVGNVLLSDEGLGVRLVERLPSVCALPSTVEVLDGGTSGMEMLEQLEDLDALILVDAIRSGRRPGTPIRLAGDEVPTFFATKLSPHQIGMSDVLATLELLGRSPKSTVIIGLEPRSLALGTTLSREIEAAMPKLLDLVIAELIRLGVDVSRHPQAVR
ncbi:HyaD/HybD family hydrogenase maturation endopeptidase [Accumulibacter sp.]|uniref:HyaD/HybD family hydrogenase maturation endopeptidase n=1 Tax=Accumulibacter sp. TaxID=2053492 RepID=UPI0025E0818D|nr:HyaD/HybD family hydrogenase maturation endopeptidase [Accumulibacter sp.]MCM8596864.1 HyaD/HybD family hydrogenase maturation endopeptidase [Accumulibacter sp.]MCM8624602.1 HyaD/HybD family hydrogenase maturation endopeptidase [Accumulibacter sp.]MDS4051012.1 HyaD/HybD family hydrogenase maturation endopeptidase [Accumulibacter sp.]